MANDFKVANLVSKGTTEFFLQKSPIINTANRQHVETFRQNGYATGGSIDVKVPGYPSVQRGLSVTAQDIQDLVIPYVITENDIYNVARNLSVYEEIFDILGGNAALTKVQEKAIVDNYSWPAYQALEADIEIQAAQNLKTTAYLTPIDGIDVLGSINTFPAMSKINMLMNYLKFGTERYFMMNLTDANAVSDSLQNMFNEPINTRITKNALVADGRLAGMDVYQSPDVLPHTAGPLAGVSGITVTNVSSDGTQITLTGVGTSTGVLVKAGDRISIPSVNIVNPITHAVIPFRLVVTAAIDANGLGNNTVVVTLSYPLLASGEHANVASLPANGAPVDVFPSYNMNFAYVPSGLSAVPLPLGDIYGAANSNVKVQGNGGVPVKVVMQGSATAFTNIFRISCLIASRAFAPYVIAVPSLATA